MNVEWAQKQRGLQPGKKESPLRLLSNRAGFSLLEIIIVLAIIVLISAVALPTVSNILGWSLRSINREIATSVKDAYNAAVVTGRVHRLVYDLDKNQFWVEVGPDKVLLDTEETYEERQKQRKRLGQKKKKAPPKFHLEEKITKKKIKLPAGVIFKDIISVERKDPITQGLAYTHMFPHGLTEKTIIHLKDPYDREKSIIVEPLIGKVRILDGYYLDKEDEDKKKR